jgi:hypothetical protein
MRPATEAKPMAANAILSALLYGVSALLPETAYALTYNCATKEVVSPFAATAKVERVDPSKSIAQSFLFSTATNQIQFNNTLNGEYADPEQMKVIQPGGRDTDFVSMCYSGSCSAVLRIRTWEKPTRFTIIDFSGEIMIGECTP